MRKYFFILIGFFQCVNAQENGKWEEMNSFYSYSSIENSNEELLNGDKIHLTVYIFSPTDSIDVLNTDKIAIEEDIQSIETLQEKMKLHGYNQPFYKNSEYYFKFENKLKIPSYKIEIRGVNASSIRNEIQKFLESKYTIYHSSFSEVVYEKETQEILYTIQPNTAIDIKELENNFSSYNLSIQKKEPNLDILLLKLKTL